jgi:MOSC domain-containing protein YiiM
MRTFDELETLWHRLPPPPRETGTVRLLCQRLGDGVHATPDAVEITTADGVIGDRWHVGSDPEREAQVTLINATIAELVAAEEGDPHEAGDNIHVDFDLSAEHLPAGSRLRIGQAVLEVSATPHTGCSKFAGRFGQDALRWTNWRHWRERRLRGVNCRVLEGGTVRLGDPVVRLSAPPTAASAEAEFAETST